MARILQAPVQKASSRLRRGSILMAALFILLASLIIVAVPVWLIMPFKAQTPRGVHLSYLLRRWSPSLTILATLAIIVLTIYLWRGARWWTKGFLGILVLISLPPVWASRQNHFEWMFKPIARPEYANASQAGIADSDMVMAVDINGEAVAYPIREMAYHHVVEDVVGGVALAATY